MTDFENYIKEHTLNEIEYIKHGITELIDTRYPPKDVLDDLINLKNYTNLLLNTQNTIPYALKVYTMYYLLDKSLKHINKLEYLVWIYNRFIINITIGHDIKFLCEKLHFYEFYEVFILLNGDVNNNNSTQIYVKDDINYLDNNVRMLINDLYNQFISGYGLNDLLFNNQPGRMILIDNKEKLSEILNRYTLDLKFAGRKI